MDDGVRGFPPNKFGPHPSWKDTTFSTSSRAANALSSVALADLAVRRASLPSPYVWIPWTCCIWSTWIGRAARASQEGREQLHCLLPSTRSSTSRRFHCICASSGNLVISDSSSSCFAGKILFCASVATPYPFTKFSQASLRKQQKVSIIQYATCHNLKFLNIRMCIERIIKQQFSLNLKNFPILFSFQEI
jgi:hypothetical protein